MSGVTIRGLAPILVVDAAAPSLAFWADGLGFAAVATVPEAPPYQFVMLARDGVTVMLQTRGSVEEDVPAVAPAGDAALVYVTVADLDAALAAIGEVPVVVPRRRTFYGADEVFVREPGGHVVGLAAFPGEA